MISNKSICIIGAYDLLSKSYFNELKKNYENIFFINLLDNIYNVKDLYNYKIFELKKILNHLKSNDIKEVIFLGKITRPDLTDFKNDGIVEKYIPLLFSAYKKGDGAVLKAVIKIFKEHNLTTISPFKYSDEFVLKDKCLKRNILVEDKIDIKKSSDLLDELSKFDNAQSAVTINGYIIAIEAVEGTDALLDRVYTIRKDLKQLDVKSGFLTKKPKNLQSKLIDLPVIGPKTIKLIKKANLKGLAIDFNNTMIYRKKEVIRLISKFDIRIFNIK